MNATQTDLFPERNRARYGDGPPLRRLFLRAQLRQAAGDERIDAAPRQRAFDILQNWVKLEADGKLEDRTETALQVDFLKEVFGEALGYTCFSEGLEEWNLESPFAVPPGRADAALGFFRSGRAAPPRAIIELKGPRANLDRDRFDGRTAVQQCWDYLNALPDCPWGIVCNYVSFRLYHRSKGNRAFELFTLAELANRDRFDEFYCIFARGGLLQSVLGQAPRADRLLEAAENRQRVVGPELYRNYHEQRLRLIEHLCAEPHGKSLDAAIRIAQKILDRVVFVAFCEDRGLLPANSIRKACHHISPFARVTNPRWRNLCDLFRSVDEGNKLVGIPPYDGVLFRPDPEVDDLQLGDEWAEFFRSIGDYDFRDEVSLDILGHLFEQSINDLERLRTAGLHGELCPAPPEEPRMAKSPERKRGGVYYTPPQLTEFLATTAIQGVISDRYEWIARRTGVDREMAEKADPRRGLAFYWRECLRVLQELKILDPACGSGAFLIQAYEVMEGLYRTAIHNLTFQTAEDPWPLFQAIPEMILGGNLYGVDLSAEAVEITQLALWIRSARAGKTLTDLSHNIICGNSLVDDGQFSPVPVRWAERFPEVFSREGGGFDCIIGNPPWERMKLQEREFFDLAASHIASAVSAATRRRFIRELEQSDPDLHRRYLGAVQAADRMLEYVRSCGRFPLTGKGDVNTYAVFAELARSLVAPTGRIGLLVPSGIATDHTTREFFADLVNSERLIALYDFENKAGLFPDVHRSYKFCTLLAGGSEVRQRSADFAFFCHDMKDLRRRGRHIELTGRDFKLLNPNTRTCPIFRTRRDAEITKDIYRRIPILINRRRREGGNPWGIRFLTMFHQTNDAELFTTAQQLEEMGFQRKDGTWRKGKKVFLPLYEAKMVQAYDHRAASVRIEPANWMRQGQTTPTTPTEHHDSDHLVEPRWWVAAEHVTRILPGPSRPAHVCFKDVTSPTNQRTMIAAFLPHAAAMNSAPLILTGQEISERAACCLLASLNSLALDFVARQKVGGVHLNFFIVEQLPVFDPPYYQRRCPWAPSQKLEAWLSERVLRLTCTSRDMLPLARAARFRGGVHRWDEADRADLQAQLDAAYFLLYQLSRDEAKYILSTFAGLSPAGGTFGGTSPSEAILNHYDRLKEQAKA